MFKGHSWGGWDEVVTSTLTIAVSFPDIFQIQEQLDNVLTQL